jgi:hypothetical protein
LVQQNRYDEFIIGRALVFRSHSRAGVRNWQGCGRELQQSSQVWLLQETQDAVRLQRYSGRYNRIIVCCQGTDEVDNSLPSFTEREREREINWYCTRFASLSFSTLFALKNELNKK